MLESNREYDWWCSWPTGKDEHLADSTVTEDGIDYSYNNLGFRGSAFHGTSGIVGDSYVYGTGVNFPFANQLGLDNLGWPAASNDRIVRHGIQYIGNYKPELLIVCWTYGYRREWITPSGAPYDFKRRKPGGGIQEAELALAELGNDAYDQYVYQKNQMLIQLYCKTNNVRLIEINNHTIELVGYNRAVDGKHPDQSWHNDMADLVKDLIDAE